MACGRWWVVGTTRHRLPAIYQGFAGADDIQAAFGHPLLKAVHFAVQMVERIDDEEQRLILVDREILIDDPLLNHLVFRSNLNRKLK
ncbi:MAG: hypothetical protein QF879_11165 [Candidatus Latescibacteria bacterium]|nr:hypothetical protein [Candidatus Latescibacterota bacterium]